MFSLMTGIRYFTMFFFRGRAGAGWFIRAAMVRKARENCTNAGPLPAFAKAASQRRIAPLITSRSDVQSHNRILLFSLYVRKSPVKKP